MCVLTGRRKATSLNETAETLTDALQPESHSVTTLDWSDKYPTIAIDGNGQCAQHFWSLMMISREKYWGLKKYT